MNSKPSLTQTLENRSTYIGGSDLADLLNEEPYGCARRLWYEKRGVEPDYEQIVSGAMTRGTRLEDLFAEEYELLSDRKVRRAAGVRDRESPELGGHIDRHIVAFDERGPGVLEIKSLNEWSFRKFRKEGLPTSYIMQLQYYIRRKGWTWGSYLVGNADSWRFEWFDVALDEGLCDRLDEEARGFYRKVESGEEPGRLKVGDARCQACGYRTSCQGKQLLAQIGSVPDNIERDDDLEPMIHDYFELKQLADEAAEELDNFKEQMKALVGNRPAVETRGAKILWSTVTSMRIDTKAVEKLVADLRAEYTRLQEFYAPLIIEAVSTPRKKAASVLIPDLTGLDQLVEYAKGLKKPSISRPFRIFAA